MHDQSPSPPLPSQPETEQAVDGYLRHAGREFLVALHATLRALTLYPLENAQVQKALDDLVATTTRILEAQGELDVRVESEFIFVNGTRLRLELNSFAFFSHVFGVFRHCGIGAIRIHDRVGRPELQRLVGLLVGYAAKKPDAGTAVALGRTLQEAGVTVITVEPRHSYDAVAGAHDEAARKDAAKRTYARSVAVTKEVINGVRLGRATSIKKVKRVVQGIVDQVLHDEASIIGLTTLRDYDEYTFTHSVNVCTFAVALGRKLGLTKAQLCDLGLAALLHDVGKARVPLDVLNKEAGFSEEDWRLMQAHPWLGVLTLFGLRGYGEVPYRPMIAAYEHHMKVDLTGYPKSIRPRRLSILSKIIAVVDSFDAATSRRSYRTAPVQPDQVLREMWQDRWRGHDPVVVKAFISLMGIYPVGTCVILDTHELGIVHAANSDPTQINRPMVRVVAAPDGVLQSPGTLVDLAERDEHGTFLRTIIKVTDPEKYGLKISDYFV
ncbi:MAG TPA: HD domain-containing phosphohydrolase [Gemmatimonadales bacterium]